MQTDTIRVCSNGAGFEEALEQTEAAARFRGLSGTNILRLRLLAEEMMGMLRSITGELEADYTVESKGSGFCLKLVTDTDMNAAKRKKLISASTSGKNAAAVGVMGKLRCLFESAFEPMDDEEPRYFTAGWTDIDSDPTGMLACWTLNTYRESVAAGKEKEEKDELERSIVANIADDIKIGILGDRVEMTIFKDFGEND